MNQSSSKDDVLLIKPTNKSITRLKTKIKQICKRKTSMESLVHEINPVSRGWANYYRISWHSHKSFKGIQNYLYGIIFRFIKRLHPTKSTKWLHSRYIHKHSNYKWRFGLSPKILIYNIISTKILKLKILKSGINPYFNNYYYEKNPRVFVLDDSRLKIYKYHKYKCAACGESLFNGEQIDLHHVIPKSKGGNDSYKNLVPLHRTCHVGITHARKQWFKYKSK
jgi:RNA-directed DNA polymerase